jgi:hypothetical protein
LWEELAAELWLLHANIAGQNLEDFYHRNISNYYDASNISCRTLR